MPNGQSPTSIVNALTIDVEDYFQVSAFESVSPPETWDQRELRVEANTDRVLGLLADRGVKATFFVLGWVAERCPELVRRIAGAGHEVASHGTGHRRVVHQTRGEFREDVRRSKSLLEDLAGQPVLGYRAPSYSISPQTLWAFDELVDAGYRYDSSVFPIRHDLYGMPDWPRFPFQVERLEDGNWVPAEPEAPRLGGEDARKLGSQESRANCQQPGVPFSSLPASRPPSAHEPYTLLEVPIPTMRLMGRNLPIAGGGYFRLFPYAVTRWGLGRINRTEGRPFLFYLHPWELDPDQPRMEGAGLKSRFRHYLNLGRTEGRFMRLLQHFGFAPVRDVVSRALAQPSRPAAQPSSRLAGGRP
jgi:polysaccharide deacetylase family protein (PEP-CTERM system associated)